MNATNMDRRPGEMADDPPQDTQLALTIQQGLAQDSYLPEEASLRRWVGLALPAGRRAVELTIRIVDREEGARMNRRWRGADRATNVLAFPAGPLGERELDPLLGDLLICAPVVTEEARCQGKSVQAHWAHCVIHGVLHLLGFDHHDRLAAQEMETLETQLLRRLGFPDPYRETQ